MIPKDLILTGSERSLLKGALRTNTHAWKWVARFIYAVFLVGIFSYLYIYFHTGLSRALSRAISCGVVLMIAHTITTYQSLIRKLYSAVPKD